MSKIVVNLTLEINIPDKGLNVNGLLLGLKTISSKVMLTILEALFHAIEERTIDKLQQVMPVIRYGRQSPRMLKTSFGAFQYGLAKVKNIQTNEIRIPLRDMLKIPKYRRYQDEAMESAIGLAVHLSYNRSNNEVDRIRGSSASRTTVWRRLQEFSDQQCQWKDLKKIPYTFLMVDGTGIHLQGPKGIDIGQKEMRWALASTSVNQPFDIVGVWIDRSWKEISNDLQERLDYNHIEVLISDGGPGIEGYLLKEGMRHQRCVFHAKRDFPFFLYEDGIKKKNQIKLVNFLKTIPALNMSNAHLETLSVKDKKDVKILCQRTDACFKELVQMLNPKRYPKTRTYIQNLSDSISVFFHWWLERGEWIPFTSNLIENRFSQVKNRIKRIGRRWSDQGLQRWLMVTIQKIFLPNNWNRIWRKYLKINQPIKLVNIHANYNWC